MIVEGDTSEVAPAAMFNPVAPPTLLVMTPQQLASDPACVTAVNPAGKGMVNVAAAVPADSTNETQRLSWFGAGRVKVGYTSLERRAISELR